MSMTRVINKYCLFAYWISSAKTNWSCIDAVCFNSFKAAVWLFCQPTEEWHICKAIIIGSDNGLSTKSYQAIIWTNDGLLLIRISLKI